MTLPENKIFCIGLPRTGTTSLDQAFRSLGIASIHYPLAFWEKGDYRALDEYQAFSDTPVYALYETLDAKCPSAKFILTTRSIELWLESMAWHSRARRKIWKITPGGERFIQEYFGSASFDRRKYRAVFEHHHETVATYFADRPDDLLILDISQEPDTSRLLDFLQIDQAPSAWPRANPSRKPTLAQELAYRCEQIGLEKTGAFLRKRARKAEKRKMRRQARSVG